MSITYELAYFSNLISIGSYNNKIDDVKRRILELNASSLSGGDKVRQSKPLSKTINSYQREIANLQEQNEQIISLLGYTPVKPVKPEIIKPENLSTVGVSALPLWAVGLLLYSGKGMK